MTSPLEPPQPKSAAAAADIVEGASQLQAIALDNRSFSAHSTLLKENHDQTSQKMMLLNYDRNSASQPEAIADSISDSAESVHVTVSRSSVSYAAIDKNASLSSPPSLLAPTGNDQPQVSALSSENTGRNGLDSNVVQSISTDHIAVSDLTEFLRDSVSGNAETNDTLSRTPPQPSVEDRGEDIKEVQIETEDPSHLFWVPFHMHPEIAPNEYNKWLNKHGVDTNETGSLLLARKPSVSRRRSVLSEQYNPEDDEDGDEVKETKNNIKAEKKRPLVSARASSLRKLSSPIAIPKRSEVDDESVSNEQNDFLSGVFSIPLEQMGEPPLKTKISLRRNLSHSAPLPESNIPGDVDISEDLATAKRTTGLRKGGMSLLRRSARTKIRRDSTASMEVHNDASRLRQTVNENGEYPAVTLVDPGPMPLPVADTIKVETTATSFPVHTLQENRDSITTTDSTAPAAQPPSPSVSQPLKRFVSTLRDSSKPTITTYIEPQLLEQRRRDMNKTGTVSSQSASDHHRHSYPPHGVPVAIDQVTVQDRLKNMVTSSVTYPIPPPKKLTQNLLQHPQSQPPASYHSTGSARVNQSVPLTAESNQSIAKKKIAESDIATSSPISASAPVSKKVSTWSWFKGKDKNGVDRLLETAQTNPSAPHQLQTNPNQAVAKKQSTLSLLFSRNGKTVSSSKVQATTITSSNARQMGGEKQDGQGDSGYEYDPWRMPIHIERAIYRMSHVKLANPRRPLHEQVLISNMMFWYLGIIQQQQMEQQHYQSQLVHEQKQQEQCVADVHDDKNNTDFRLNGDQAPQQGPLNQGKSQLDTLHNNSHISEPRIDGSEQVVPQQDSNSHARSPSNSLENNKSDIINNNTNTFHKQQHRQPRSTATALSRDDSEYDEESMMGGGYMDDYWGQKQQHRLSDETDPQKRKSIELVIS
ncbi:hypothetical protein BGZ83_002118 [Gryganskiella cystojenkinii]|nr:hypothetical protein BGZ83_002118 [Gryganskiella cystojenkinii]